MIKQERLRFLCDCDTFLLWFNWPSGWADGLDISRNQICLSLSFASCFFLFLVRKVSWPWPAVRDYLQVECLVMVWVFFFLSAWVSNMKMEQFPTGRKHINTFVLTVDITQEGLGLVATLRREKKDMFSCCEYTASTNIIISFSSAATLSFTLKDCPHLGTAIQNSLSDGIRSEILNVLVNACKMLLRFIFTSHFWGWSAFSCLPLHLYWVTIRLLSGPAADKHWILLNASNKTVIKLTSTKPS